MSIESYNAVLRVLLMCDETGRMGRSYSMGSLAIRQDRSTRFLLAPTSVLTQYPLQMLDDPLRRLPIPLLWDRACLPLPGHQSC